MTPRSKLAACDRSPKPRNLSPAAAAKLWATTAAPSIRSVTDICSLPVLISSAAVSPSGWLVASTAAYRSAVRSAVATFVT